VDHAFHAIMAFAVIVLALANAIAFLTTQEFAVKKKV